MFGRKLTKDDRERLRAQRRETQLITARARANKNFEYVVNPPEIPKVAFGSCMNRYTMPVKGPGMSSFMRSIQGEVLEYPGPLEYVPKIISGVKVLSKKGYAAFANKMPRMPPTSISSHPPVGTYDIMPPKPPKQAARPFGIGVKLGTTPTFVTPGPPTYPYHLPPAKPHIDTAFLKRRLYWPAVAVFCSALILTRCFKCRRRPVGDFFRKFSTRQDMCRDCMRKQTKIIRNCRTDIVRQTLIKRELKKFKPVRFCTFFHNHQGSKAATLKITRAALRNKINTENYLFMFHKE